VVDGVGDALFDRGEVQPATNTTPTTTNAMNKVQCDLFISKAPFDIVFDSTVANSQQEQMHNSRVFIECLFYKSSAMPCASNPGGSRPRAVSNEKASTQKTSSFQFRPHNIPFFPGSAPKAVEQKRKL
ncbi:MAG: hypothetical protein WAN11_07355, partial [Syntrophobacteraceae bacterium]